MEIELFGKNVNSLAVNFAAKEAASKALGTGFAEGINPLEIEILRNEKGEPKVRLYENAQKAFLEKQGKNIFVSLSHEKEYAVAYVVMEG